MNPIFLPDLMQLNQRMAEMMASLRAEAAGFIRLDLTLGRIRGEG